jgi:hypothetical protein
VFDPVFPSLWYPGPNLRYNVLWLACRWVRPTETKRHTSCSHGASCMVLSAHRRFKGFWSSRSSLTLLAMEHQTPYRQLRNGSSDSLVVSGWSGGEVRWLGWWWLEEAPRKRSREARTISHVASIVMRAAIRKSAATQLHVVLLLRVHSRPVVQPHHYPPIASETVVSAYNRRARRGPTLPIVQRLQPSPNLAIISNSEQEG